MSPGRPAGAGRRGPQKTRWRTADQVLGGLEGRACSGVHPERREAGSRGWFGTHHAPPTQSPATAPPGAGNPGSGRGQTRARAVAAGCAPPPGAAWSPRFESRPWRDSLRSRARALPSSGLRFPIPEVSKNPCSRSRAALSPHAATRGGAAARPPQHARSRERGRARARSHLAAARAALGGRGREAPPRPRPRPRRANRRGRLAPCGATRWGWGLRGLREPEGRRREAVGRRRRRRRPVPGQRRSAPAAATEPVRLRSPPQPQPPPRR